MNSLDYIKLIESYCMQDDLSTYDPYDVWKTFLGSGIKRLFNYQGILGIGPAAFLTLYDTYINNALRIGYSKVDYPIVRAFAVLILINLYAVEPKNVYRIAAAKHLEKLLKLRCSGFAGSCWGLGWRYPVKKGLVYDKNAPYTTVTPYALEAFIAFTKTFETNGYDEVIQSILPFFNEDIKVLQETDDYLVTSYGALYDRIAYNSISYTMYSFALLLKYANEEQTPYIRTKIRKLYNYIVAGQEKNGSWYYSPEGRSFVDCFHSCFILKNIIKTSKIVPLEDSDLVVKFGYEYLKNNFRDPLTGLFVRFVINNKPGIVKYDLYDNAEMLNLALLAGDTALAKELIRHLSKYFWIKDKGIYSKIDRFGKQHDFNTLRWAVFPFLYGLSEYVKYA